MIVAILIVALFFYLLFKQFRIFLYRKYELKLFTLRDKLRMAVIDGEIENTDWTFYYLDSSISKMTKRFKMLNIFHAMYLRSYHKNDQRLIDFKKHLRISLDKNAKLKEIYDEYQKILNSYVFEKHIVLFSVTAIAIYGYLRSVTKFKKWKLNTKDSINRLIFSPETSTSDEFIGNYKPVPVSTYRNSKKSYQHC
ncbi:MAG: hypothetical protein V4663_14580 [Bacteroidota bacterium]